MAENVSNLLSQHSEEMYDPEIYRHQIAEYYNPYVLDADIQAGEFYFNIDFVSCEQCFKFKLFYQITVSDV